jgi:hypothetical protein
MTANEPKQNGSVAAGLGGQWKSALARLGLRQRRDFLVSNRQLLKANRQLSMLSCCV